MNGTSSFTCRTPQVGEPDVARRKTPGPSFERTYPLRPAGPAALSSDGFETFFARAQALHSNRSLIKGVVCGIRVEEVDDPLMQQIRQLDKLVDELAKGKAMEKILRQ